MPTATTSVPSPPLSRAADDDAYLDGLFTYCLSVMCEHDAATAALGEALALGERQQERGRRPAQPELLRPWWYALARWSCLRGLSTRRTSLEGPVVPRAGGEDAVRRRRELASLAWPEAAGTTPEQRECLELAVRHQLSAAEIARVLRLTPGAARTVLTSGACEVERTRAALAAVAAGGCPVVASLARGAGEPLGPGPRRELVRHVDECLACRRTAQRFLSGLSWPGATPAGAAARLTVLPAPRQAVRAARQAVLRARAQHSPRFDKAGFPLPDRDRAVRRERLRGKVVTTTVVAAVLAAPALALWAAYRSAPEVGEASGSGSAATEDDAGYAGDDHTYEHAGRPSDQEPETAPGEGAVDTPPAADAVPGEGEAASPSPSESSALPSEPSPDASPSDDTRPGPGRLTIDAMPTEAGTLLTLSASGGAPVDWTVTTDAGWLRPSQTSGTLRPGETATVVVAVDREAEPAGPWKGHLTVDPAGTTITVEGHGAAEPADPPGGSGPPEEPEPPEDGASAMETAAAPDAPSAS